MITIAPPMTEPDDPENTGSGGFIWDYSGPSRLADWDANIAMNAGTEDRKGGVKTAGESLAILRNSIKSSKHIWGHL